MSLDVLVLLGNPLHVSQTLPTTSHLPDKHTPCPTRTLAFLLEALLGR